MYKMHVNYEDFNGVEREEDLYFNFTVAELSEMQLSINGGLSTLLEKIMAEKDQSNIIKHFKKLVLDAYGEKSLDGKLFVKNEEIRERFRNSAAYSAVFMKLGTDDKAAAEFINSIMPQGRKNSNTNVVNLMNNA